MFVAHHDAANGGLIFRPELTRLVADTFPAWYERQTTSPQMLRLVAAGPALAGLGALAGGGLLRRLGATVSALSALAFLDIGTRTVVPGANDNLTAVAVILELARLLREEPVRGVRVLLVSTGSEESFMEGMRGWVRRHGPGLDPARTRVVVLETLGSPELILLEGEGMIWMTDYDAGVRELIADSARRAGVALRRGLRLGFATDALSALRGGLRVATLASCDEYKMPANYHSQRDIPRNVDFGTVGGGRARRRGRDQVSSERARPERLLARGDLARVARLLERGEQRPEPRAGLDPERGRQLVAAHQRRAGGLGTARERRAEHVARQLEVGRDRRLGVAPAGGEAVGDREDGDVGRVGLGRGQVAPDRAPRQRPLVDEEAEPQVVEGQRGDVVGDALGGAQAAQDVARELGARLGRGR